MRVGSRCVGHRRCQCPRRTLWCLERQERPRGREVPPGSGGPPPSRVRAARAATTLAGRTVAPPTRSRPGGSHLHRQGPELGLLRGVRAGGRRPAARPRARGAAGCRRSCPGPGAVAERARRGRRGPRRRRDRHRRRRRLPVPAARHAARRRAHHDRPRGRAPARRQGGVRRGGHQAHPHAHHLRPRARRAAAPHRRRLRPRVRRRRQGELPRLRRAGGAAAAARRRARGRQRALARPRRRPGAPRRDHDAIREVGRIVREDDRLVPALCSARRGLALLVAVKR